MRALSAESAGGWPAGPGAPRHAPASCSSVMLTLLPGLTCALVATSSSTTCELRAATPLCTVLTRWRRRRGAHQRRGHAARQLLRASAPPRLAAMKGPRGARGLRTSAFTFRCSAACSAQWRKRRAALSTSTCFLLRAGGRRRRAGQRPARRNSKQGSAAAAYLAAARRNATRWPPARRREAGRQWGRLARGVRLPQRRSAAARAPPHFQGRLTGRRGTRLTSCQFICARVSGDTSGSSTSRSDTGRPVGRTSSLPLPPAPPFASLPLIASAAPVTSGRAARRAQLGASAAAFGALAPRAA